MATATADLKSNTGGPENAPNGAAPQAGTQQAAPQPAAPDRAATPPAKSSPIPIIIAAILVIAGGAYGLHYWSWSQTHIETDDAYLTGNLINVSPRIGGILSQLTVAEGDQVKKGQLLAHLEDSDQQSALRQAQAAFDSAKTQIPEAQSNLTYQQLSTAAAIDRAKAALASQQAKTQGAGTQVALTRATTTSQIAQAQSQVEQALAQAAQVAANVHTAQAQIASAQQGVQTAQKGVTTLAARVSSAQADLDKAKRDEARYDKLFTQQAVTQSQVDAMHAQTESAASTLNALQQQIEQAQSQAAQAQVAVKQAQDQYTAAQRAADAAQAQVGVAYAGLNLARAGQSQVGIQRSNYTSTGDQNAQAQADVAAAQAGSAQIDLRKQQIQTAEAGLAQAKAALVTAQVNERDTALYAPTDGTVVRKTSNIGADISAGQTVLSMTEGNLIWVTANLKETQLATVRIGQPVEVRVDALPDKEFEGVVASVNAATGASVSLLPPDNATGNFTKVVQRVPVKIALIPSQKGGNYANQDDFTRIGQGMSAVVTIDTSDKTAHPDKVPADFDRLPGDPQAAQ